ncbi:hypothetical protein BH09MYX1_BH09MYX1_61470 [soil metagenome]
MARFVLTHVRGWCANSRIARVRLAAERDVAVSDVVALREEARILRARIVALREEARILRARISALETRHRPRYPPPERLAILVLRAARGWTAAETARRFLITVATVASWMKRLDEKGADALVALPEPVNRFPDFVGELVRRMRASFPVLGRKRICDMLARAGVHLSPTTAARLLARKPRSSPSAPTPDDSAKKRREKKKEEDERAVTAKAVHDLWHVDLTILPTVTGWWTPWVPFALLQRWPFCFWLGAVLDHVSRSVVAWKLWTSQPTAEDVVDLLELARTNADRAPRHIVSDRGAQFQGAYVAWCVTNGAKPRYGVVGKHGSIAVLERFWRSLKSEMLRRLSIVPLAMPRMAEELTAYVAWYHEHRPHQGLDGRTPREVLDGGVAACDRPRFETRPRFPLCRGAHRRASSRGSAPPRRSFGVLPKAPPDRAGPRGRVATD